MNQIIDAIVNHIPVLFIVVGIIFTFLALFNVDIKPPTVKVTDKLNQIRKIIIGIGIFFVIIGLSLQLLSYTPSSFGQKPNPTSTANSVDNPTVSIMSTPTMQITATPVTPVASSQEASASSLIPTRNQPVINDPLKDNSGGYDWDIQSNSNESCKFGQVGYILSANVASDSGLGCQAESSSATFSNFVFQVKMTILTGLDKGQAGAGPSFRMNTTGTGQQYQVLFDVSGNWQVSTDTKALAGGICAEPCPHFHVGLNQPNYITIRATGKLIQIQINGYDLGSFTDDTYSSGAIGFQLNPGANNSFVAFSDVRVWQL